MWLLDVQADYGTNTVALWLKGDNGAEKFVDAAFKPRFYVWNGSREELAALSRDLETLDCVGRSGLVKRRVDIGSDRLRWVLEVAPRRYSELKECARIVDSRGGYRDYQLFNVDLRLEQAYLLEKGLFPMARVRAKGSAGGSEGLPGQDRATGGGRVGAANEGEEWGVSSGRAGAEFVVDFDDQFAIDYEMPPLKEAWLSVETGGRLPSMASKLAQAKLGDVELVGGEAEILQRLNEEIARQDPDVIYTDGGDEFALPFLYHRAELNGLELTLGREPQKAGKKPGRSYFTYGTIVYKPGAQTFRGRLHIDSSSFMFREAGLFGVVDMARLSGLPVQTIARLTPGSAISAMQVQQAWRDGYLIAWKKNVPEDFKSAEDLFMADRGGFIFDPPVGIHGNVVEVDFTSLYPNIMARYNISPETLLCKCCPDSRMRVPGLLYNTCEKRRGIVPRVVEPLIARRMACKRLMKSDAARAEAYKQRSSLLKWTLVTCFGYTGYKNSRFGRIECHEAINAYAREIMVRTREIAEEHGYRVLHGIIDSMWMAPLRRGKRLSEHEWFCGQVSKEIGIPLALEGVYKWIVFLPTKGTGVGALNKYYGCFESGELKVRGIELRKHDAPPLVKEAQKSMLEVFSKAGSPEQFVAAIPTALSALSVHLDRLRGGGCELSELVLRKRVSRSPEDYRQNNFQASALRQLKRAGKTVNPGECVRYVVVGGADARPVELLEGDESYHPGSYEALLFRAAEALLLPFGYSAEKISASLT